MQPYLAVQGDACAMPFQDGIFDLILFSPPYGLHVDYPGSEDVDPEEWPDFLEKVAQECARVGKPNCRLAVNVPLDGSPRDNPNGGPRYAARPLYADMVAAFRHKWTYRATVMWNEDNISKSTARGSMDSANAPHIVCRQETIGIFHRGEWNLGRKGKTMEREEWLSWTSGTWAFRGETRPFAKFPAAFPVELPRRLLRLLSFPGDLILDCFCGSGTTGLACLSESRRFVGLDVSTEAIAMTRRRLDGYVRSKK